MKMLVVCCIVLACGVLGLSYKQKFTKQLKALKEVKNYCLYVKDNLYLFKDNIEEININYINMQKNKNANNTNLYKNISNNMQDCIKIWLNNIFNLEVKSIIKNSISQIGVSDYCYELIKIDNLVDVLNREIVTTEIDCKQKGDLYFKLSLAVGVVVGVLIW